jgi:hypothetical protein
METLLFLILCGGALLGLNAWKVYKEQVDGMPIKDLEDGSEMWSVMTGYFKAFVEDRGQSWADYAEHLKTAHPRSQAIPREQLEEIANLVYPHGDIKMLPGFREPTIFVYSNNDDINYGFIVRSIDLVRSYYMLSQILIATKRKRDLGADEGRIYDSVTSTLLYFGFAVYADVCDYFDKHTEYSQDVTEVSRAINEEFRPGTNYYVHPEQKREAYEVFLKSLTPKEYSQYFAEFNAQVEDLIEDIADVEEEHVDLQDAEETQHDRRHAFDDRPELDLINRPEGYTGQYGEDDDGYY